MLQQAIDIAPMLSTYKPITLEEMNNVKLMDRVDKKFVFNRNKLPSILTQLESDYRILNINNVALNRYETLYFDDSTFHLYHEHHKGKLCRYKVRSRKYVDSNLNFFEVKYKNNKGRTIKNRIKQSGIDYTLNDECATFLKGISPINPYSLEGKLWSNCTRITFVSNQSQERLTLDIDLHFSNGDKKMALNNIVIAELKQEKSSGSIFNDIMKKERIKEGSISKYCIAAASLYDEVKKNNFKQKLKTINKINHAL